MGHDRSSLSRGGSGTPVRAAWLGRLLPRLGLVLGTVLPPVAIAVGSGACFVGYNSAWGQSKAAQKHLAADVTPGSIGAAKGDGTVSARRTYHVRFRPDGHYLAETVNPEQQLEQLVTDANEVLRPAIGLELDVDVVRPWGFDDDAKLEPALGALRTDDPGGDVDVVVGLVGALPGPTDSLHQVGYAEVLGKHVVLRAAGRLGERDDIDRTFYELSDEEKARMALARRRHRAEAVFLHEIGHVLGALHEVDRESLMRPAYDEKMSRFGDDALVLMGLALSEPDRDSVVKAQLDYLRTAKPTAWPAGEREQAVRFLETMAARSAPGASPSENVSPGIAASPSDLRPEDGPIFAQASQRLAAGSVADAYAAARPLFDRYPRSIAVQDMRCQLATLRYLAKDALVRECAPYLHLVDGGAPAGR